MGKSILFLFMFLMSSVGAYAQGYYDDMYYTPSAEKENVEKEVSLYSGNDNYSEEYDNNEYVNSGIVAGRDVDEYNRRYVSEPVAEPVDSAALSVRGSKGYYDDEYSDEGWINGFNGSQSDYEYSTRIIRMSSPSLAIHISSPYYWDVVYGSSSFDWNVYVDGSYAYAFPTFSNPLWWDWRYGHSYYGFYNRWYYPYYPGLYAGGYPYYWGGWHHHYYPYHGCYPYYGHYYPWHGSSVYYSGNRVYNNSYRTGSSGRVTSSGNRVGTSTRQSSATTARRSSINSYGTDRRNTSTYNRRSETNDSWSGFDSNNNSSSSFDTGVRRSSSTYNRRSSTVNSGFNSGSSNRSSSFASPSRSGSYNSSRSSYTPSSRSGSRR